MTEASSFGAWLRRRRRLPDLTQDELAQRVGCAASMIRKIEADVRRYSSQVAGPLAAARELPVDEHAAFRRAAHPTGPARGLA